MTPGKRPRGRPGRRKQQRAPEQGTPVRAEVSAGGVVYRSEPAGPAGVLGGELEIALAARRTQKGDLAWGLPKGNIEPGESREEAAVREVREETGVEAVVEQSLGDSRYFYVWEGQRIRKVVHFFLMRATGGDITDHDHEMEEVRWFPLAEALREASYSGEREVLHRAAGFLTGGDEPAEPPEPGG